MSKRRIDKMQMTILGHTMAGADFTRALGGCLVAIGCGIVLALCLIGVAP